ncbi:MAG: GrdX family protein [Halanaerobiales bacterium]|nr:GrdX family protein [Halanaerobiales bacterium]
MKKYVIVTNNNKLINKYNDINIEIIKEETIEKIFEKTRDLIHKGFILISHPLAGSVKPYQNPYRSIILKKGDKLDYQSLKNYENSYYKYQQFKSDKVNNSNLSEKIKDDYQTIDLTLIDSALQSINLK